MGGCRRISYVNGFCMPPDQITLPAEEPISVSDHYITGMLPQAVPPRTTDERCPVLLITDAVGVVLLRGTARPRAYSGVGGGRNRAHRSDVTSRVPTILDCSSPTAVGSLGRAAPLDRRLLDSWEHARCASGDSTMTAVQHQVAIVTGVASG